MWARFCKIHPKLLQHFSLVVLQYRSVHPYLQLVLVLLQVIQTTAIWLTSHSHLTLHLQHVYGEFGTALQTLLHARWHHGMLGNEDRTNSTENSEHLHIKSVLPGLPQHKQKLISDSTHPGEQLLDDLVMWLWAAPLPRRVIEHLHCFSELLHRVPNGFHQGLIVSAHRQAQKRQSRVKLTAQRLEEHSTITNKPGNQTKTKLL